MSQSVAGPGHAASARTVPCPAGHGLCLFPGVPQLEPVVVSGACAVAAAMVRCPWPVPALSSVAWPGMASFVVGPGVGVLPRRAAATVAGPGRRRDRRRPVESMAMARRAGQVDGGRWPDHHVGTMQAHHPVRDTGRAEKRRHCQGGSRGEDRPGGQARRHHHLHAPDLRVLRLRVRRPAGAGRLVAAWAVAAAPATFVHRQACPVPAGCSPRVPCPGALVSAGSPGRQAEAGPAAVRPGHLLASAPRPPGAVAPGRPGGAAAGRSAPPFHLPEPDPASRIEPASTHHRGCQQAWRRCVVNALGGGMPLP